MTRAAVPGFSFGIRTLILSTTVVAILFTFVNYGREQWGWPLGMLATRFQIVLLLVPVFNALVAGIGFAACRVSGTRLRAAVLTVGCVGVAALAPLMSWLTDWLTSGRYAGGAPEYLVMGPLQYAIIVVTIIASGRERIATGGRGSRRASGGSAGASPSRG